MSAITNLTTRLKFGSLNWLGLVMILLSLAGLGVSGYLMWGYTVPGATLACGASQGCETVKNSPYANLMGVPLPVVGLVSYTGLLLLLIAQNQASIQLQGLGPYVALAIFGLSFIGVLYSAYLTYVELFVIYAICRWCVMSAILMTVIFFLSIFNLRTNNQLLSPER